MVEPLKIFRSTSSGEKRLVFHKPPKGFSVDAPSAMWVSLKPKLRREEVRDGRQH
jgi:hypothetical protein